MAVRSGRTTLVVRVALSPYRVLVLVALLAHTGLARADDAPLPEPAPVRNPHGVYTGITENDLYAIHNRDRHYTNGLQLGWMSSDNDMPRWADSLASHLPLLADDAPRRIGWSLAQAMFTPEDKGTTQPILNDRPYAAWLYGALKLQTETPDRLDTLEMDLGVVGPAALGEQVQNHWHAVIGVNRAAGWDNQIKNEPGLVLKAERSWRKTLTDPSDAIGVDVIPHAVGALGNIFTYGGAGATLRFGQSLESDFGPPRMDPAVPGSNFFYAPEVFGWNLFAGFEGRAVARNIFLDGNTFADSQSVRKRPLVGDLQGGFEFLFAHARLTYTQVVRTKEFYGQHHPDYLGSLSLSVTF
jgi:lipid A 3-O-deacylase